MTTVNLAALLQQAAAAGSGGSVPDGTYTAVIDNCKFQQSKQGKPQWVVTFKVLPGQRFEGATIREWQTVTADSPGALGALFSRFAVVGIDSNWIMANPGDLPGDQIAAMLTGQVVDITVEQDGDWTNVKRWAQPSGGAAGFQAQAAQPQPSQVPQGFAPQVQQPQPAYAPQQPAPQPAYAPAAQQPQYAPQPAAAAPMQAGYPQAPPGGYVPEQAGQPAVPQFPAQPQVQQPAPQQGFGGQAEQPVQQYMPQGQTPQPGEQAQQQPAPQQYPQAPAPQAPAPQRPF